MTNKSLNRMTDAELEKERLFWDDEIASADRWGGSRARTTARTGRDNVEEEQRRRRLAVARENKLHIEPWVVDDPGVKGRTLALPSISGAGKTRSEARPALAGIAGLAVFLVIVLVASWAYAVPRLVELDNRYAAMGRV